MMTRTSDFRARVRFCLICASVSFAMFFALPATGSPARSPEKIVRQYLKAIGGEKAVKRIASWRARGTVERASDGASGRYEAAAARPDLYFEELELRGFESSQGFNGKSAWRRDSREGLHTLTGDANASFRAEAWYRSDRLVNYKKEKARVSYAGAENEGGKQAHAIFLTTARNVKIKMVFDAASGFLIREEIPAGGAVKVFSFDDYRAVAGVLLPHRITLSEGTETLRIALDEYQINRETDRALFDFPSVSNEPLPDIPALLRELDANQAEIDRLREKYACTQVITKREFDKSGVLKEKDSETYELIFHEGRQVGKLVVKNGKPLSPEESEKEQRRVEKLIADIDKEKAKREKKAEEARAKGKSEDDEDSVTIADVLRSSRFVNPRRETFRHQDVIVFDFEPRPEYKPKNLVEKLMQKMTGVMWVDATDKEIVRIEARLIDSFKVAGGLLASLKSGAAFVIEQDRFNDEVWMPSFAEFNLAVRVFLVKGLSLNETVQYSNYKRFSTEAAGEVKEPIKPQKPSPPSPFDDAGFRDFRNPVLPWFVRSFV